MPDKPQVWKSRLANGLRVVSQRQPGLPRSVVCVHYGVGYRSEGPGREGFAHLFEHLMFQGSENLPGGRFYDHLRPVGGQANGTTHQDYTDYHQIVPASLVEQALFSEADRMRAPTFTRAALRAQLDGIEEEIGQAVIRRPYGGFPWPLLPGVLFRRFANAHDGYGSLDRLRTSTVAECESFFDLHYAPGNAVLTVLGDHPPEQVSDLVERHFGDISPRPFTAPPELDEPHPARDRWATWTEPDVGSSAVGLGYRLPDPQRDLREYVVHVVLAGLLDGQRLDLPGGPRLSAGCGVFGPLDARDPDMLVVTAVVPTDVPVRQVADVVSERWAAQAEAEPRLVATTIRRLVAAHHAEQADPYTRARALGRMELLFGRAELLDEIPRLLAEVESAQLATCARRLSSAAKAVLALVPGPRRTRPGAAGRGDAGGDAGGDEGGDAGGEARIAASAEDRAGHDDAEKPPHRVRRAVPPPGAQRPALLGSLSERTLDDGLRVVAVRDARVPLVELRFRLPLGPAAWADPRRADALAGLLAERSNRHGTAGWAVTATTDGQWLDLTGQVMPADVSSWLCLLEDLADVPACQDVVVPPVVRRTPERLMDDHLRRRLLAEPGGTGTGPNRGWLVAVGDIDPEEFVDAADRAAAARQVRRWQGVMQPRVSRSSEWRDAANPVSVIGAPVSGVHLTMAVIEPAAGTDTAARYLATAAVNVRQRLRMAGYGAPLGGECEVVAGRDGFLGGSRAYVRARFSQRHALPGISAVRDELRALATTRPPSEEELRPMRIFCSAQLLGAFDSPATKADFLCQDLSMGGEPLRLERLSGLLREVRQEAVARAIDSLFSPEKMTVVAVANPESIELVHNALEVQSHVP